MVKIYDKEYTEEEFEKIMLDWHKKSKDISAYDICDDDWDYINKSIGISKNDAIHQGFTFKQLGNEIKLRTCPETWYTLSGREWLYNTNSKKMLLWSLN